MRLPRALIVTLALVVSPVSAAVCEVVCGIVPHAAHQAQAAPTAPVATADEHAHHLHHAAPAPAPETAIARAVVSDVDAMSIPAPECDLRGAVPARMRTTSIDTVTLSAALQPSAYQLDHAPTLSVRVADASSSPPAPLPPAPLPLRI